MLIWKSKENSTFMVSLKKTVLAYRYIDTMVKKMWLNVEIWVKDIRKLFALFLQLLYKSVIISLKNQNDNSVLSKIPHSCTWITYYKVIFKFCDKIFGHIYHLLHNSLFLMSILHLLFLCFSIPSLFL